MKKIATDNEMKVLGNELGRLLKGGEMIELIGDVGAGKTTFTKGLGVGLKVDEDVQSPSFTISREYPARDGLELHHYDLYRLDDPGVVRFELAESVTNPQAVTVIEWGGTAEDVLPAERIVITLRYGEHESREAEAAVPKKFSYLEGVFA